MAYKRELIAKTKNLLTEIKPSSNTKVENGVVYQVVADTREFDSLKVQIFNDSTFLKNWGGGNQQIGKNTLTFTTDVLPTHNHVIFGLNGLTRDMTVTTPITLENNTTYTLSMDFINITQGEIAWTNSMLEKNSTATSYVPYGHLSSYKKLLKVSDVCQLLDKSKYPATKTVNGVTYTNNGDGIVTLSGTSTAQSAYILIQNVGIVGHKYLVYGCPAGGAFNTYRLTANIHKNGIYSDGFSDSGDGNISKVLETGETIDIVIDVKNISDANLVFKPQLFDLTEMYGAGNEPATVAEFKAKFPNDLYDYSPRCWVKSYKTGLIAKTKNLFNISKVDTTTTLNVVDNTISAKNTSSDPTPWAYNNSQYKTTLDAGRYFLSFDNMSMASSVDKSTQLLVRDDTNAWIAQISYEAFVNNKLVKSFTLDKQTNIGIQLKLYTQVISNFQIEKGSTATDYVPYGYL